MRLVEDASGRKLYICLRCGNRFWSRAKKPQCSVCKSKRVMLYEDFLKLPQEKQEEILGKRKQESGEKVEAAGVKDGETGGNSVKTGEVSPGEGVKMGESPGETGGNSGKSRESPKITQGEGVKLGDSPEITGVKKGEKPGEKVKGERVKKGFKVPVPRLSWKAWGLILGLAFIYYLYKVGWFEEMWNQLKNLGAVRNLQDEEKSVKNDAILKRVNRNLAGGR